MSEAFIGVDVGTGSARAGVFDADGRLLASAKRPIALWRETGEIVEQSSADIWGAVAAAVRAAVERRRPSPRRRRAASASTPPARSSRSIARARRCRSARAATRSATPSSGWTIAPIEEAAGDQCRRARSAALRRRDRFAGNAGAQAAMARPPRPAHVRARRAFLRPDRFPDLSRHRFARALRLHRHLQMDLSRPRASLAARVFRAHRPAATRRRTASRRIGREVVAPGLRSGSGLRAEAAEAMGLTPGLRSARG